MSSHSNVQSLTETLKRKLIEDRQQIEALTRSELDALAQTLQQQSSAALSSICGDTEKQASELSQRLSQRLSQIEQQSQRLASVSAKAWIKPFLMGLSLLLGICAGSWALMQWQSSRLMDLQQQIEQQSRTLAQIEKKTWGVVFHQNSKGDRFLVMPKGVIPESVTLIGGERAARLSSD